MNRYFFFFCIAFLGLTLPLSTLHAAVLNTSEGFTLGEEGKIEVDQAGGSRERPSVSPNQPGTIWDALTDKGKVTDLVERAQKHFETGEFQECYDLLSKASAAAPANAGIKLVSAQVLHRMGRIDEALGQAFQAHKLDPRNDRPLRVLIYLSEENKQFELALEYVQKLIKIDPKKAEFFQMRGYFQLKMDQFEDAVESYQRSIRLDPNNPETYDKLATAWAAEDRLQEAIDLYREAMEVNPDNAEIRNNFASILYRDEQTEAAREQLESALEIDPNHPKALRNLAILLIADEKLNEAMTHLLRSLDIDPTSSTAWTHYLRLLKKTLPEPEGWKLTQPDTDEPPTSQELGKWHQKKALQFIAKSKVPEACRHYIAAIEADSGNPYYFNELGFAVANTFNPKLGRPFFRIALTMLPNYAEAYQNLQQVDIFLMKENAGGRLAELETIIAENPTNAAHFAEAAQLLLVRGDLPRAALTLNHLLSLTPTNNTARVLLSQTLLNMGDVTNGFEQLMTSFAFDIEDNNAWLILLQATTRKLPEIAEGEPETIQQPEESMPMKELGKWSFEQFRKAEEKKHLRTAGVLLLRSIMQSNRNPDYMAEAARYLEAQGFPRYAQPFIEYALVKKPGLAETFADLRQSIRKQCEVAVIQQTTDTLKNIVATQTNNYSAVYQLGIELANQGKLDEAFPLFEQVAEVAVSNKTVQLTYARALFVRKDYALSEAALRSLLEKYPEDPQINNRLAWVLSNVPDAKPKAIREAMALAKKACELTEYKAVPPLRTLAATLAREGRTTDAQSAIDRAIDLAKEYKNKALQTELEKERASFAEEPPAP